MKVLFVATRRPWPGDDGGRLVMMQQLRLLVAAHECEVVHLERGDSSAARAPSASGADEGPPAGLAGVHAVPHAPDSPAVAWLRSRGGGMPVTLYRYRSAALTERVRDRVRQFRPDVAIAQHLHLAYLAESVPEVPWVVASHNVETLFLESFARIAGFPRSLLYAWEAKRMARWEPRLLRRADAVIELDARECEWVRARVGDVPVHCVPPGVPLGEPRSAEPPRDETRRDSGELVLLGSVEWLPNRDAARWFLRDIWPAVLAECPEACAAIAGAGTERLPLAPGVRRLGRVPDAGEFLASARALAVPLRAGAGVRIKILEAMAQGVAIVTTREGLGGIDAVDGEHLLLADSAADFARALCALHRDPERARRLGAAARARALERYPLRGVADGLERALADAVRGRR